MTEKTYDTTLFTLSHSSMSIMEQCPRKWFLRYVEKRYIDEQQPWSDFGLLVHEVAELYRGEGGDRIKELARQISKEKNLEVHPDYKHKVPVALRNVKRYYDKYLANSQTVKPEQNFYTDLNETLDITGSLDVLFKGQDGHWIVTDYKTSKKKGEHSRQLAVYYFLMYLITGQKPKTLKCHIVYLSLDTLSEDIDDIVEEYVLDLEDLRFCEMRVQRSMDIIAHCAGERDLWRKKPSALCNYCEYKKPELCNAKKEDEEDSDK